MYTYTNEDVKKWYNEYLKNSSVFATAAIFGVSAATVWRRLKIFEKDNGFNNLRRTSYDFDENFFSRDLPESFYWAGFIAADGNIKHQENRMSRLSIGLAYKDKEHLENFKKDIKFNGPVLEKNDIGCRDGKSAYIQINNNKICNDLEKFNIIPKKSLIYTFPEWLINNPLVNHFMRGYFDGDGCISFNTSCYNCPYFTILGTEKFLYTYRQILILKCGLNKNSIYSHKRDRIYSIAYGGKKNIKKISDFLYENISPSIYLKRKYEKMISGDKNG